MQNIEKICVLLLQFLGKRFLIELRQNLNLLWEQRREIEMNNHYRHVCKENYCPVVQQNVKYNLEKLDELENVCDRYESCKEEKGGCENKYCPKLS
jgi:hypothetical protein